ncbi:MAG: hypothetical protein ACKVJQ_00155 [Alphaproteobacteria bacterium]|jgi:hypothetical protein
MPWTIDKIGIKARVRAMAAAKSAGLDLGPWLDRAILDSPETGPRAQESPEWGESPIHDALTALEQRIDSSHSRLTQLIDPIDDALHEMGKQVPKLLDQGQNPGNAANADLQEAPPHASPGTNDPHLATESSSATSAGSASSANDDDERNISPVFDASLDISDQDIQRDVARNGGSADEADHSQPSNPASEWHPPARSRRATDFYRHWGRWPDDRSLGAAGLVVGHPTHTRKMDRDKIKQAVAGAAKS